MLTLYVFICFFKQKTAYEMRISDWSSDVCSSDLRDRDHDRHGREQVDRQRVRRSSAVGVALDLVLGGLGQDLEGLGELGHRIDLAHPGQEIGRASCRERGCQYV